jgi:hypothetical protein
MFHCLEHYNTKAKMFSQDAGITVPTDSVDCSIHGWVSQDLDARKSAGTIVVVEATPGHAARVEPIVDAVETWEAL